MKIKLKLILALAAVVALVCVSARAQEPATVALSTSSRIASIYLSENLVDQWLKENLKTPILQDVTLHFDSVKNQIAAHGLLKIPTEEIKAVNLEKGLGDFRFQVAIQVKVTRHGHLILIFPLDQTFFYPADSKDPNKDRIIIPVQLLSLALASTRGYLAVLSGDFSGFDRKTQQLKHRISEIDGELAATRDPDEKEGLTYERRIAELELEGIPIERRQGERTAKKMANLLGFVGDKEINLNQELAAHRNAIIVRIQVGQLAPYLKGIELGGVRLLKDERDGSGENFIAIDINAQTAKPFPIPLRTARGPVKIVPQRPPDVVIRLNQTLFESETILNAEKDDTEEHLRNFSMEFKEDGIHAEGDWHIPLLPPLPFSAVVDFVSTANNVFEVRVRDVKVLYVDITPLTGIVLKTIEKRLDKSLQRICVFDYVGEEKDRSRALRVTVNMPALLPAFPKLALTGIAIKEKELLLKAGEPMP